MKRNLVSLLLAAIVLGLAPIRGQTSDANQEARLLALVKEVQTQQAQLAANQAKIEEKLAAVSEIVKDARLYSKRAR